MNFSIKTEDLQRALARVSRAVPAHSTVPILTNVLVNADNSTQTVTFTGFDLSVAVQSCHKADVSSGGAVALPGAVLARLAKSFGGDEVRFSNVHKQDECCVECGSFVGKLIACDAAEFPLIPDEDAVIPEEVDASAVAGLLSRAIPAASNDATRANLNSVFMEAAKGADGRRILRAVALDGHRMHVCETIGPDGGAGLPDKGGAIVPLGAAKELQRLLAETSEHEALLGFSSKVVLCHRGEVTFVARLVDGAFPDYREILPPSDFSGLCVSAVRLATELRSLSVFVMDRDANGARMTQQGSRLELNLATGLGSGESSVQCRPLKDDAEERDAVVCANISYLLDALNAAPWVCVQICIDDPMSPIIIRRAEDDGLPFELFCGVVMPIRIDG